MSNSLNTNPIVLSGSLPSYKAAVAASLGVLLTLVVEKVRWVNPPANSTLSIGDPLSGAVLELLKSDAAGDAVESLYIPPRLWQDFSVDSLTSGQVLIYVR